MRDPPQNASITKNEGLEVISQVNNTNSSGKVQATIDPPVHGDFASSVFDASEFHLVLWLVVVGHLNCFACRSKKPWIKLSTIAKFDTKDRSLLGCCVNGGTLNGWGE